MKRNNIQRTLLYISLTDRLYNSHFLSCYIENITVIMWGALDIGVGQCRNLVGLRWSEGGLKE
jgi:hypothetical protein